MLKFLAGGLTVAAALFAYFVWGWNEQYRQAAAIERAAQRLSQGGKRWIRE
jgi:hypothetical protein